MATNPARSLPVDGIVVAEDSQIGLRGSGCSVYIGVRQDYAAGTFFTDLIDDVRICDRAVKP